MSNKSLISIDYGTRKCGLAYSVEGFCFAHRTIGTTELIGYLEQWIPEKNADTIVIGLPVNIDGTESKQSSKTRKFARKLEGIYPDISIILHDERLTTSEARLSGVADIDAESARLILESYIHEVGQMI